MLQIMQIAAFAGLRTSQMLQITAFAGPGTSQAVQITACAGLWKASNVAFAGLGTLQTL